MTAARRAPGQSYDYDRVFDFNLLMCVVEDYQSKVPNADLSLLNIMSNSVYDEYCRENDDGLDEFTAAEKAALNRVYTGQDIADNSVAQLMLNQMAITTLPLNATGESNSAIIRERARQRINNALGFIYTTPFIFAEGQ